jgi:hypothetical protein
MRVRETGSINEFACSRKSKCVSVTEMLEASIVKLPFSNVAYLLITYSNQQRIPELVLDPHDRLSGNRFHPRRRI